MNDEIEQTTTSNSAQQTSKKQSTQINGITPTHAKLHFIQTNNQWASLSIINDALH